MLAAKAAAEADRRILREREDAQRRRAEAEAMAETRLRSKSLPRGY
jgi:hypothetical protein